MPRIHFFRHGKADKTEPNINRRLVDEGKTQARSRREKLGNPDFNAAFCTPFKRTEETIEIISGGTVPVRVLSALVHDSKTADGKLLDAAFEKLGYAPLIVYFEQTDEATREALRRFGATAWEAIMDAIADMKPDANIAIGEHAVLTPLMVLMGCGAKFHPEILQINLGECHGIWVEVDEDGDVTMMGTYCD